MKLIVFISHRLTEEQIEDARTTLGVQEIIEMPKELKQRFSAVPPELEDLSEYAKPFVSFLFEVGNPGDYAMIQGEFGLVYRLVEAARVIGVVLLYSTTERIVHEEEKDGEIVKISQFRHVRFRRF
ncbi:MAG: hypothetical protein GXO16_01845 [Epsilonproteobacteria bacterium]|nr:hypothetical protein [Campylobacterota bacterium]